VIDLPDETPGKQDISFFLGKYLHADLLLCALWLVACIGVIYTAAFNVTLLRIILALPVVLFIPGYCFIAALFPKKNDINLIERFVLSIGLTIAVVPMISLVLNFTPWGMNLDPLIAAVTIFTFSMTSVAFYRRSLLPMKERFGILTSGLINSKHHDLSPTRKKNNDRILSIILVAAIIVSILTTIYIITVPLTGEEYTEFFILGQNRTGTSFPDRIVPMRGYPMFVGITNHEYVTSMYMIETWMVQTEFDNTTNTSRIITMDPNERMELTLMDNETRIIPFNLTFKKAGYNRVEFLLFKDYVPEFNVTGMDRINQSYRDLHLWITEHEEG